MVVLSFEAADSLRLLADTGTMHLDLGTGSNESANAAGDDSQLG